MVEKNVIQEDWANKDFVESLSGGIKTISEFLNKFELHTRQRLGVLNEKLVLMERRVAFLEERVSTVVTRAE